MHDNLKLRFDVVDVESTSYGQDIYWATLRNRVNGKETTLYVTEEQARQLRYVKGNGDILVWNLNP